MSLRYFKRGFKYNYPVCCIMFFDNEWDSIRKIVPEYGEKLLELFNNIGYIPCPSCLVNILLKKKGGDFCASSLLPPARHENLL